MKKFWLLLLAAVLAAGCTTNNTESTQSSVSVSESVIPIGPEAISNEDFESFLDQYVIEMCERDYTLAHHYFEHPEKYGVDISKCKVTLGSILPDADDLQYEKDLLKRLESMQDEELSKSNRQIRQQLLWQTKLYVESAEEKYQYLDNIWSTVGGVPSVLTDFFSEYQIFGEEDVKPLVELINDVPRYVDDALAYSKKQAELKTLAFDLDTVLDACQSMVKSKDDSPITKELLAEIDGLNLEDKAKADSLKKEIRDALNTSFFPAFQTIIDGVNSLKEQNGKIKGLASYKNGREYYELLLKSNSGSDAKVEEIRDEIRTAMDSAVNEYRKILRSKPEVIAEADDPQTRFKNVADIMPFLEERYPAKFPIVDTMDYEIKELSNEQATNGVMAYFVVPPIDSKRPYEIRYNARDYASDPSSLQLYDTFAHEGIPGHMYQTQYEKEHFHHTAQYFLSSFGMQEGYATYAAYQTCSWSGVNEDVLKVWELADLYSNYSVLLMDLQVNYDGYSLSEFEDVWGAGSEPIYKQLAENPSLFFGYYYGNLKISELQTIAKESLGPDYDDVAFNTALLEAGNVEFGIVEENVQDYIDSVRSGKYGEENPSHERPSEAASESPKESKSEKPASQPKADKEPSVEEEDDLGDIPNLYGSNDYYEYPQDEEDAGGEMMEEN